MPYVPTPPRPIPEQIMEEQRAREAQQEKDAVLDPDEMRTDSDYYGRGAWLVVLLGILGVAGLFLLLYWLARLL